MRCNRVMVLCFCLVILATPSQARAQLKAAPGDWPGWRGADRTGVSAEIGPVAKEGPPSWPGPRATPTVDGERIYVLGSDGDLACLDLEGKVIWHKNLGKDLDGTRGRWAYAESPLIDGDVLVCTPGGAK